VARSIARVAATVRGAVDDGRLAAADAERFLGRLLLDGAGGASNEGSRLDLVALGVEPSLLEAAVDEVRSAADAPATSVASDDVARVLERVRVLGDPDEWLAATTYDSVALAIVDSVWSIGVRYTGVLNVLGRYRELRRLEGGEPEHDRPRHLVTCIDALGGPDAFAEAVNNRQRTSARSGILKAEAVLREAKMLADEGIETPGDIAGASPADHDRLKRRWTQEVPGQGSGLSWDYLHMLMGMQGVKADRMIRRFVADALGLREGDVPPERAHALVTEAAAQLGMGASHVDYAIWRFQSGQ
jgi:hypothetical protein